MSDVAVFNPLWSRQFSQLLRRMLVGSCVVLHWICDREFVICVVNQDYPDASVKLRCVVLNAVRMKCHWFSVDPSVPSTSYQMFFSDGWVVVSISSLVITDNLCLCIQQFLLIDLCWEFLHTTLLWFVTTCYLWLHWYFNWSVYRVQVNIWLPMWAWRGIHTAPGWRHVACNIRPITNDLICFDIVLHG